VRLRGADEEEANVNGSWSVSGASVVGRDHVVLGRSAQDALGAGERGELAWGVVCDGCGEGARSEVGAGVAAAFLAAEMERRLAGGAPPAEVPEAAVRGLLEVLAALANAIAGACAEQRSRFVREHLLATAIGFCARGAEGVVFACGDGLFAVGDEVVVLDEEGRPSYPAYATLGGASPIVMTRPFRAEPGARVAVATDGFDAALVPEAFGRRGHALRRWMNVRARAGSFRDDASIVTAERLA
jgi:hypothetical protein